MAKRYEYCNWATYDSRTEVYGSYWSGQTFIPSIAHRITSVKLKLWRHGSPGTITVSIRATSGGRPTGGDLCSGTTNGNTLSSEYTQPTWREISLGDGYNLAADTQYAIVVRAPDGDSNNDVDWWKNGDIYAGGTRVRSTDSDSSWTSFAGDLAFEEWGVAPPTVSTVAANNVEETTANPRGNVTDDGGIIPTRYIDYDIDSGAPYANSKNCGTGGVGEYNSNLTGLSPGTKYYYRARAVNSEGTGTGNEMTFTTKPNPPTDLTATAV